MPVSWTILLYSHPCIGFRRHRTTNNSHKRVSATVQSLDALADHDAIIPLHSVASMLISRLMLNIRDTKRSGELTVTGNFTTLVFAERDAGMSHV